MFETRNAKKTKNAALQTVITQCLTRQLELGPESEEFAQITAQLSELYKLQESDSKKRVTPDTMVAVGANLAGIVAILGYERTHVVTSKALGFVGRMIR